MLPIFLSLVLPYVVTPFVWLYNWAYFGVLEPQSAPVAIEDASLNLAEEPLHSTPEAPTFSVLAVPNFDLKYGDGAGGSTWVRIFKLQIERRWAQSQSHAFFKLLFCL